MATSFLLERQNTELTLLIIGMAIQKRNYLDLTLYNQALWGGITWIS